MAATLTDDNWLQVKANIQSIWADVEFGDKELRQARGNLNKMVHLIHQKTGEPTSAILQKMSAVF